MGQMIRLLMAYTDDDAEDKQYDLDAESEFRTNWLDESNV